MDIGDVITIQFDDVGHKACIIIDKKFGSDMNDQFLTNSILVHTRPPYCFYVLPPESPDEDWYSIYSMTLFYKLMYGDNKAYMRGDLFEKYVVKD